MKRRGLAGIAQRYIASRNAAPAPPEPPPLNRVNEVGAPAGYTVTLCPYGFDAGGYVVADCAVKHHRLPCVCHDELALAQMKHDDRKLRQMLLDANIMLDLGRYPRAN